MSAEFPRTSYERAVREYDQEFQQHLAGEIITAIAQASIVSDPDLRVMALVLVGKAFPRITLETALVGLVFRTLLAKPAEVLQ